MPPEPPAGVTPEIALSREWFAPRRLGELLPPLLRGEVPAAPIEIGV